MERSNLKVITILRILEYCDFEICNFWGEPIEKGRFSEEELENLNVESMFAMDNINYINTWVDCDDEEKMKRNSMSGKELDEYIKNERNKRVFNVNVNCNYDIKIKGKDKDEVLSRIKERFQNKKVHLTTINSIEEDK